MPPEDHRSDTALAGARSRRAALHTGSAFLAGVGVLALRQSAAAQAIPIAEARGDGPLLVQSFSQSSLFPTQGDAGGAAYTVILWDAADRGFFFADWTGGAAEIVPSERVLAKIGIDTRPRAVLVASSMEENGSVAPAQEVWAMRLVYGDLGSDSGAVTYQGEPLAGDDAISWLETAPEAMPEGPHDLGQEFLIITGVSGFDDSGGVRLELA